MRTEVKTHAPAFSYGVVVHVSPPEDFGFIRTQEGQNVYFHRNSLLDGPLEQIGVGDRVRFTYYDANGAEGPHASGVSVATSARSAARSRPFMPGAGR
jgi:cold shock CspA family protein